MKIEENKNNAISYLGVVSVRFVKDGKLIKNIRKYNTGYSPLFTFITKCFCEDYNQSFVPSYLMLYSKTVENGNTIWTPTLTAAVYKSKQSYGTGKDSENSDINYWYSRYEFIIPGWAVTDDSNAMALFNANNKNNSTSQATESTNYWSALLDLKDEDKIRSDIGQGVNIIITWELRFSNKIVEQGGNE